MEEPEAEGALQFGRRGCRTRDGSGHSEDAEGRTDGKGGISCPSLSPTQPTQPTPWAREVWVASRGPLCPRKALKWGTDLGKLASLPNTPRGGGWLSEKGLTRQIWGNKTGGAQTPLPCQWWNGSVLRYNPSGQQRGKGLEPRLPLGTQGQREGARPHPHVHSRSWGRSDELESPAPRPGLPEHSPIQVPIAWLSA